MPKRIDHPVDPEVKIPAAVKAAAAAAEALHREAYPGEGTNGAAPNGNGAAHDEPPAAPPVVQAQPEQPELSRPDAQPTPAAPAPQGQQEGEESWEHRYRSLRGRFDNQESRHTSELRSLREHVANLENTLGAMHRVQQQPVQAPPELQPARLLTPAEEQEYGTEFLGVVGKRAREELNPEVERLKQEIGQLKSQLGNIGTHVSADARARMEQYLDQQLPSWREINYEPAFMQWLALRDMYSGAIRHELLKAAFARNDAPRVLAFFQGFISDEAATTPRAEPEPGRSTAPKIPLANLAAPGRAQSAAPQPAEKPVITTAQIARFYADCAAGKYRGREDEKSRLEAQIFAAQRDGRIVQ